MSMRSASINESGHNQAQEERGAADTDTKRFTDTPEISGGEKWEESSGHSGTRRAWTVSLAMVASFLVAGVGMTFGPRLLLWIGIGLFVVLGVYSLAAHSWSDFTPRGAHEGAEADPAD
jgi:opacity protein-like surface antigen